MTSLLGTEVAGVVHDGAPASNTPLLLPVPPELLLPTPLLEPLPEPPLLLLEPPEPPLEPPEPLLLLDPMPPELVLPPLLDPAPLLEASTPLSSPGTSPPNFPPQP